MSPKQLCYQSVDRPSPGHSGLTGGCGPEPAREAPTTRLPRPVARGSRFEKCRWPAESKLCGPPERKALNDQPSKLRRTYCAMTRRLRGFGFGKPTRRGTLWQVATRSALSLSENLPNCTDPCNLKGGQVALPCLCVANGEASRGEPQAVRTRPREASRRWRT